MQTQTKINPEEIRRWLAGGTRWKRFLIEKARVSVTLIYNCASGYQPHRNRAEKIIEVLKAYPDGPPEEYQLKKSKK